MHVKILLIQRIMYPKIAGTECTYLCIFVQDKETVSLPMPIMQKCVCLLPSSGAYECDCEPVHLCYKIISFSPCSCLSTADMPLQLLMFDLFVPLFCTRAFRCSWSASDSKALTCERVSRCSWRKGGDGRKVILGRGTKADVKLGCRGRPGLRGGAHRECEWSRRERARRRKGEGGVEQGDDEAGLKEGETRIKGGWPREDYYSSFAECLEL